VVRTDKRRVIVDYLKSRCSTSERRACGLVGMTRRAYSYKSCKDPQTALRQRIGQKCLPEWGKSNR
jgi:putative transposase